MKVATQFIPPSLISSFCFLLLILMALLVQSTAWFGLLNWFPSPNLWVPLFIYLMLNRSGLHRVFWFLTMYILLLTCTVALPFVTFLTLSVTFFIIHFLQSRFSTLSIFDLVLLSTGAIVSFPLVYSLVLWFGSLPFSFDWLGHLGTLILSLTVIPSLLMLCRRIDKAFNRNYSFDDLVLEL